MRIGGLASGMNVDEIIDKLMTAERMPLERMEQDKVSLTWKRDAFREMNLALKELDDKMLDMKMSKTYQSKTTTSSQEDVVTATAFPGASSGTFKLAVEKLATSAMNIGKLEKSIDLDAALDIEKTGSFFTFSTMDAREGEQQEYRYTIQSGDSLRDVIKRVNADQNHVRMFVDPQQERIILETTRTGNYHTNDSKENLPEIMFDPEQSFFKFLGLDPANETGGTNATFTYNDQLTLESTDNNYTLNGITFSFQNITKENAPAFITVQPDIEDSVENIKAFVEQYNKTVDLLNGTQREERHRDYKPLTEAQKEEMSEKQIEMWEEKAKSGILRGESIISDSLLSMRQSWYAEVETEKGPLHISQIGITTTQNFLEGGKLEIDEKKLKEALRENPQLVQKMFSNDVEGKERGIMNQLEDAIQGAMQGIEKRAGKSYSTLEGYGLGKNMKDLNNRIAVFEEKLVRVENRYWRQFTAMEKAIQRMNQQSAQLLSQFGGQ